MKEMSQVRWWQWYGVMALWSFCTVSGMSDGQGQLEAYHWSLNLVIRRKIWCYIETIQLVFVSSYPCNKSQASYCGNCHHSPCGVSNIPASTALICVWWCLHTYSLHNLVSVSMATAQYRIVSFNCILSIVHGSEVIDDDCAIKEGKILIADWRLLILSNCGNIHIVSV